MPAWPCGLPGLTPAVTRGGEGDECTQCGEENQPIGVGVGTGCGKETGADGEAEGETERLSIGVARVDLDGVITRVDVSQTQ